ncbi:hypothetical protein HK102_002335, partial [Quaeritorhiza haematococci]
MDRDRGKGKVGYPTGYGYGSSGVEGRETRPTGATQAGVYRHPGAVSWNVAVGSSGHSVSSSASNQEYSSFGGFGTNLIIENTPTTATTTTAPKDKTPTTTARRSSPTRTPSRKKHSSPDLTSTKLSSTKTPNRYAHPPPSTASTSNLIEDDFESEAASLLPNRARVSEEAEMDGDEVVEHRRNTRERVHNLNKGQQQQRRSPLPNSLPS